jgi:Set1/Ash2 histone methyltransferase complex subunit ASH2
MLPSALLTDPADLNQTNNNNNSNAISYQSVRLDPKQSASKLLLDDSCLTVTGRDGYRTIRSNAHVSSGTWYYECKVNLGTGHVRVGFSTNKADLNTPVGSDQNGYAIRDINGDLFHQGRQHQFVTKEQHTGESFSFGPGDVIGCLIDLPELDEETSRQRQILVESATQLLLPKSKIIFYKNGIKLGVAFSPLYEGTYFAALSLYKSASLTLNPGPFLEFAPRDLTFQPFSNAQV